jgi:hypothetical protein
MLTIIGKLRALCLVLFLVASCSVKAQMDGRGVELKGELLSVGINADGSYSISQSGMAGTVLRSDIEADTDSKVLRSLDYPQHQTMQSEFHDQFGSGSQLTVRHTGITGMPDLVSIFRLYGAGDHCSGDPEHSHH